MIKPRIELVSETKLIGMKTNMSFANNKTSQLWQTFMPRKKDIKNNIGSELYSVEIYNSPSFFSNFNPNAQFEKWAAIKVADDHPIPSGMDSLVLTQGLYAVFIYKGKATEAATTYQYILGTWIPNSEYNLDDRPHFALMGDKYKNNHPDSEEELWFPIKLKNNDD